MDSQLDIKKLKQMVDELHKKELSLGWDEKERYKALHQLIGDYLNRLRYQEQLSRQRVSDLTAISVATIKRAEKGKGSSEVLNQLFQLFLERDEACMHPQRVAQIFLCKLMGYLPGDAQFFTNSSLLEQLLDDLIQATTCPSHSMAKQKKNKD